MNTENRAFVTRSRKWKNLWWVHIPSATVGIELHPVTRDELICLIKSAQEALKTPYAPYAEIEENDND